MKKRLAAAFLIVGAISATMVMGASAFWTTEDIEGVVTASSGQASIEIAGCDTSDAAPCSFPVSVTGIYPGWSDSEAGNIFNTGNVPLNIYIKNDAWSGNADLRNQLRMKVDCGGPVGDDVINAAAYQAGYQIATIQPGASVWCSIELSLPESGSNQNNLQNQTTFWTTNIWGATN